ncbi:aspartyl-tRNA(Asn)/glutamyl-tRNA(Gln) amidotransferase subunit A [Breoghania corrubedonensis]|uniref:Aspartyl-tRNA(Asn)/glutamyl-tRNA(Gln) amidotransferase subunit A n=1 Tax=Breoghania corrubedonensis TaxID=665038 RepID=A0A2T5V1G0_9HYPH|nr:AtzE family amidohydrolase [Breoghania corrubedonensis]PTW57595.1 aspartyl-tRNA(Asn)/glutamyl-tRNA(Gln) amidotransferase subunit A [Breoghania corrubedonensis]
MHLDPLLGTTAEIIEAVRLREVSALDMAKLAIAAAEAVNPRINAFTEITAERALKEADTIDTRIVAGEPVRPLAGLPYAVKNLFDIEGVTTRAGSKINRDNPPAVADAALVARMKAAGALLIGALNMDEYAYGFTGTNEHDGDVRNPHDPRRMTGGSSAGAGAAVAAGVVPMALGSDTNGSIRVPASFCGTFGLKATYGRFSRVGAFPFVTSFDHVGPLARSARGLAVIHDAIAGFDPTDPVSVRHPLMSCQAALEEGVDGLRIAVAGGWFRQNATAQALAAVDRAARTLGVERDVELPETRKARLAAYVLTASEGGARHLGRLRERPEDFEAETRNRLIAGSLVPSAWAMQAQRVRRWYHEQVLKIFDEVDAVLTPTTPFSAPEFGTETISIDGETLPLEPNIGLYTQPFSFIGLPAVSVPVWLEGEKLPLGVQIVTAPWREDIALRIADVLEREGVAEARVAMME